MTQEINTICLPMFLCMGRVNCYLVNTDSGDFLIDTGGANARKGLLRGLVKAGYTPGSLKFVILTHGDFDHSGNAAYLRSTFGVRVALHQDDAGMVEKGDMFASRKRANLIVKALAPVFTGYGKSERFTPDFFLKDGYSLARRGLDAKIIHLPGHSRGSVGILTASGDLFCGDLFENTRAPRLNALMDDPEAAQESLTKLEGLGIRMVYPGHGEPFEMSDLKQGKR